MLGKTINHVPVFPPVIGGGITRGQMVLITALPRTGLPKSDLQGHLARRLYTEGKWSKEQFEEFCKLRQQQLDPLGLEGRLSAADLFPATEEIPGPTKASDA